MEKEKKDNYRLTELSEPTEGQLSEIMKEVAEEAKYKSEVATQKYFQQMFENIRQKKKEWSVKYNINFENA
ncbi:MAG: hypothetical protein LUF85_11275 [Bacteroides sp.]|nr:hypothetical protein [Bacteroides sp.]